MLRESLNTESLEVNKRVDKVNIDRMNDVSDIQSKVNVVSGLTSCLIIGLIVIDFEPLKITLGFHSVLLLVFIGEMTTSFFRAELFVCFIFIKDD